MSIFIAMWEKLVQYILNERAVVRAAPIACAAILLLGCCLGFVTATWHYSERIEFLDREIADYKDKLQQASPMEVTRKVDDLLTQLNAAHAEIDKLTALKPDRHLSEEQKTKLESELQAISQQLGNSEIAMGAIGDPEPQQYLRELTSVFKKANIHNIPNGIIYFDTTVKSDTQGLFVSIKNTDSPSQNAQLLLKALNNAGLKARFEGWDGENADDNFLAISVGYTPPD